MLGLSKTGTIILSMRACSKDSLKDCFAVLDRFFGLNRPWYIDVPWERNKYRFSLNCQEGTPSNPLSREDIQVSRKERAVYEVAPNEEHYLQACDILNRSIESYSSARKKKAVEIYKALVKVTGEDSNILMAVAATMFFAIENMVKEKKTEKILKGKVVDGLETMLYISRINTK